MSATQKFFRFPFALNGDRLAVPDVTPVDGTVGYQIGYGFDYQRAPGDGLVKNLERNKWNQLLYEITLGLRQYQTLGFPEFIPAAENGGFPFPYAKNAFVRWTDGQVYVSMADNNTTDPTDATKWSLGILGTGIGAVQFFPASAPPVGYIKANGAVLTRAAYPALWQYAQASGNIAVSDGAWQRGQFSPGDGVNNFRIPDARGYHPRAWDDGRVLGSTQADSVVSHAHAASTSTGVSIAGDGTHTHENGPYANFLRPPYLGSLTGNDTNGSGSEQAVGPGDSAPHVASGFHGHGASASSATTVFAAGGAENRVKTVAWLACIKYL
jgi:hypothetical protein